MAEIRKHAFIEPLGQLKSFEDIKAQLAKTSGIITAVGCVDTQKPHIMNALQENAGCVLVVTFNEQKARELTEAYQFFDSRAVYFPAKDILFYQSDIRGNALTKERIFAYKALTEEETPVIITTIDALMDRLVRPEIMLSAVLELKAGEVLDMEKIRKRLVSMGYESGFQAEQPGQFAVRGGIIDIFPFTDETPCRIELWGDEIDSIRIFSPETQRSVQSLEQIRIYPASELVFCEGVLDQGIRAIEADADRLYKKYREEMKTEEAFHIKQMSGAVTEQLRETGSSREAESYLGYFYQDTVSFLDYFCWKKKKEGAYPLIFLDEPSRCMEKASSVEKEYMESMRQRLEKGYVLPGQVDALFSAAAVAGRFEKGRCVALSGVGMHAKGLETGPVFYFNVKPVNSYNNSFDLLVKDLKHYKRERYGVILVCSSQTRARRMASDLTDEGLSAFFSEDTNRIVGAGEIMLVYGKLAKGFEYPDIRFAVLTETDIFGRQKKKSAHRKKYEGEQIHNFSELNVGDYVVHENHGLGIYKGIEKIEVHKKIKDYVKIEYDKGSVLYVLATQLDPIQKYAGSGERKPKLNKLGSQEWVKTRSRVQKAVREIAQELVDLYAVRQRLEGFRFEKDTVWQREFEEMFPYEETDDQLQAIEDTKSDMQSSKIMDRLICGDVGFGKTEVAIRAAFKAVQEQKQVVYLVPTTILAQQHYNTFVQRMKDFPVNIDLMCRFRTPSQQKKTIEGLKRGTVDIVIGTHRLLSKDIAFKDVGLLIIDEEQRFGVTHKEKIKQLRKNVDVLALSATPIPRTLHMSLIGIRDMSVLEEPPHDRMPVQTYVMEYNEEMVREAIERELARDGQVYYVYNRIGQIDEVTSKIAQAVPDAVVEFAHGQMPERALEDVMYRFINGEIDVLVSTTIIETGLDIGNVNTMIIHDADQMGLSQLYQLRGRIGRSNRTAYAFLMYRRNKILKETAEKRLSAIRDFSELGSGFKIAMKDLEIRGAGNLLGEQQHGHMEAVGYDMYCKMLNEAVKVLKGEKTEAAFDTALEIDIDAYIPDTYIMNEYQKLDIYKRIAAIRSEDEKEEILDELIDRFGEPPKVVQNLLLVALMKVDAHIAYYTAIEEKPEEIIFRLYEQAPVNAQKIPALVEKYRPYLTFMPDKTAPYFVYRKTKGSPESVGLIRQVLLDSRQLLMEGQQLM